MNRYLSLFLLPALLFACTNKKNEVAQNTAGDSLTITGKFTGMGDADVSFGYEGDDEQPVDDTIHLKDGAFSKTVKISSPREMYLAVDGQYLAFYAGPGSVEIKGDLATFTESTVEGNGVPKDYLEYRASVKDVEAEMVALENNIYNAMSDTLVKAEEADRLNDKMPALEARKAALDSTFIKKNPSSHYAALMLFNKHSYIPDADKVAADYNVLTDDVKAGLYGKKLKKVLDIAVKTAPGQPAMDFTLNDVNGKPVSLSSYKGKYVLVDFWASWCRPCREENPSVVKAYQKYNSKGFDVLGVSLDEDKDQWQQAIKNDNLTWTHISDLKGWRSDVVSLYNVVGIPYNLLLDKNGIILGKGLFGNDLEKKLAEHVK